MMSALERLGLSMGLLIAGRLWMPRLLPTLLCSLLLAGPSSAITYAVDRTAGAFTIVGTIEVHPAAIPGPVTNSDITTWSITVSTGGNNATLDPGNSGWFTESLFVDANSITWIPSPIGSGGADNFVVGGDDADNDLFPIAVWGMLASIDQTPSLETVVIDLDDADDQIQGPFEQVPFSLEDSGGAVTIATAVPEPVPSIHPIALYTLLPSLLAGAGLVAMERRSKSVS
jgi:hypothetical protein